jgi:hypothetical protein
MSTAMAARAPSGGRTAASLGLPPAAAAGAAPSAAAATAAAVAKAQRPASPQAAATVAGGTGAGSSSDVATGGGTVAGGSSGAAIIAAAAGAVALSAAPAAAVAGAGAGGSADAAHAATTGAAAGAAGPAAAGVPAVPTANRARAGRMLEPVTVVMAHGDVVLLAKESLEDFMPVKNHGTELRVDTVKTTETRGVGMERLLDNFDYTRHQVRPWFWLYGGKGGGRGCARARDRAGRFGAEQRHLVLPALSSKGHLPVTPLVPSYRQHPARALSLSRRISSA